MLSRRRNDKARQMALKVRLPSATKRVRACAYPFGVDKVLDRGCIPHKEPGAPQPENTGHRVVIDTMKKIRFMLDRSRIVPISGAEPISPKKWMIKMFRANA